MELINITTEAVKTIELFSSGYIRVYHNVKTYEVEEGNTVKVDDYEVELFENGGDVMTVVSLYPKTLGKGELTSSIQTSSYSKLTPEQAVKLAKDFQKHANVYMELHERGYVGRTAKELFEDRREGYLNTNTQYSSTTK